MVRPKKFWRRPWNLLLFFVFALSYSKKKIPSRFNFVNCGDGTMRSCLDIAAQLPVAAALSRANQGFWNCLRVDFYYERQFRWSISGLLAAIFLAILCCYARLVSFNFLLAYRHLTIHRQGGGEAAGGAKFWGEEKNEEELVGRNK